MKILKLKWKKIKKVHILGNYDYAESTGSSETHSCTFPLVEDDSDTEADNNIQANGGTPTYIDVVPVRDEDNDSNPSR